MLSLRNLYRADGGICFHCKKSVERKDATREHVWPKIFGGPDIRFNLRLAHKHCNWNRKVEDFWQYLTIEDGCWVYKGPEVFDLQIIRVIFKHPEFKWVPRCGAPNCVRPNHMVGL